MGLNKYYSIIETIERGRRRLESFVSLRLLSGMHKYHSQKIWLMLWSGIQRRKFFQHSIVRISLAVLLKPYSPSSPHVSPRLHYTIIMFSSHIIASLCIGICEHCLSLEYAHLINPQKFIYTFKIIELHFLWMVYGVRHRFFNRCNW